MTVNLRKVAEDYLKLSRENTIYESMKVYLNKAKDLRKRLEIVIKEDNISEELFVGLQGVLDHIVVSSYYELGSFTEGIKESIGYLNSGNPYFRQCCLYTIEHYYLLILIFSPIDLSIIQKNFNKIEKKLLDMNLISESNYEPILNRIKSKLEFVRGNFSNAIDLEKECWGRYSRFTCPSLDLGDHFYLLIQSNLYSSKTDEVKRLFEESKILRNEIENKDNSDGVNRLNLYDFNIACLKSNFLRYAGDYSSSFEILFNYFNSIDRVDTYQLVMEYFDSFIRSALMLKDFKHALKGLRKIRKFLGRDSDIYNFRIGLLLLDYYIARFQNDNKITVTDFSFLKEISAKDISGEISSLYLKLSIDKCENLMELARDIDNKLETLHYGNLCKIRMDYLLKY